MRQATKPTGPRIIIPIGSVFEKWTVIGAPEPAKEVYGLYVYPCRCECGNIGKVRAIYLTKNLSSRCQECGPRDAGKAVKQLELEESYILKGKIKTSDLYTKCPFSIKNDTLTELAYFSEFDITILNKDKFEFSYHPKGKKAPKTMPAKK